MGLTIHYVGCLVADIPVAIVVHRGVLALDTASRQIAELIEST